MTEARGRAYAYGRARARREPATSSHPKSPASVRPYSRAGGSGGVHGVDEGSRVSRAGGRVPDGKHVIFAVDPGGTTGYISGSVTLSGGLKETLATVKRLRCLEFTGDFAEQANDIWTFIQGELYQAQVAGGIRADHIHLIMEDFVLQRRREGGATGVLTSCWVAGGLGTLARREGWEWEYQQPSVMQTKTNDRLKHWGFYDHTIGSEHKRAATKHFVAKVDALLP